MVVDRNKKVVGLDRDIPILYKLDGKWHRFLVDFRIELKKGKPVLVEVKCPYFLDTRSTKAKVRAAKRYAQSNDCCFVLASSLKQVEGCCE